MDPCGRILALDIGDRRIGLAVSDPLWMTAQRSRTSEPFRLTAIPPPECARLLQTRESFSTRDAPEAMAIPPPWPFVGHPWRTVRFSIVHRPRPLTRRTRFDASPSRSAAWTIVRYALKSATALKARCRTRLPSASSKRT